MADCCAAAGCELEKLDRHQRWVLWVLLWINVTMFVVELVAGMYLQSTSLAADSLDMFGDSLVYLSSIWAVGSFPVRKAKIALFKGFIMLAFGLGILGHAFYKWSFPFQPPAHYVLLFGSIALLANSICLALLWKMRSDDINMRSVWLCSRNDIIANTLVMVAAVLMLYVSSQIPDLVVGLIIAGLFTRTAIGVIRESYVEINAAATSRDHCLASTMDDLSKSKK